MAMLNHQAQETLMQVMLNDQPIDFNAAVALMDDDIRERLHGEMAPCSDQEFIDAYAKAHQDAFGEVFRVN
jgi:hypothetical protein